MGRVFIAGESYESVLPPFSLFTAEEIDGMLALTPPAINQNFEYAFFIDSDNHLASTEIALQPYANATIKYSNFTSTQSGILPRLDQFNIVIPKTNVQASIDWKWNSAKWDSGLTLDRTMPNGYTHVTLSDFFAAIFK
jgi:hypothetical protein